MKKRIFVSLLVLFVIILTIMFFVLTKNEKEEEKSLEKITLAEVTHSPFYAPLYVALENGYFKELGLDVQLLLTPGADKVATSVIAGDAQIGFAGAESAIYVYKGEEEDYLVTFADPAPFYCGM